MAAQLSYPSDASYLADEFEWIRLRVHRIAAEKTFEISNELEDAGAARPGRPTSRDARLRTVELREAEQAKRKAIDARLVAHRRDEDAKVLGLDVLRDRHQLNADERLIVLATCVHAFGPALAEKVFGDLPSYCGALAVSDLIVLLDCQTLDEQLVARKRFRPGAALRWSGLIVLGDGRGHAGPESLLGRDVRLSMEAWSVLVGDESAGAELAEVPPEETDD